MFVETVLKIFNHHKKNVKIKKVTNNLKKWFIITVFAKLFYQQNLDLF